MEAPRTVAVGYRYEATSVGGFLQQLAVAYLAHENCPVTGECIESGAGTVKRYYVANTTGFTYPELTIDSLAAHWDEVMAGTSPAILGYGGMEIVGDAQPYNPSTRPQ